MLRCAQHDIYEVASVMTHAQSGRELANIPSFHYSITPVLPLFQRALSSWTASTMAFTFSTGVSGKTP
jgi:hypothetical protein